jgi:hypothetical protein
MLTSHHRPWKPSFADDDGTATDRRASSRRQVNMPARWSTGEQGPLHDCMVLDISAGGARLMVDAPLELPEHFTIELTSRKKARRRCRVVWRAGHLIGIMFAGAPPRTG